MQFWNMPLSSVNYLLLLVLIISNFTLQGNSHYHLFSYLPSLLPFTLAWIWRHGCEINHLAEQKVVCWRRWSKVSSKLQQGFIGIFAQKLTEEIDSADSVNEEGPLNERFHWTFFRFFVKACCLRSRKTRHNSQVSSNMVGTPRNISFSSSTLQLVSTMGSHPTTCAGHGGKDNAWRCQIISTSNSTLILACTSIWW